MPIGASTTSLSTQRTGGLERRFLSRHGPYDRSIGRIDWNLDVDRQKIKGSPEFDPSMTVDRAYENHFHNYYSDIRATYLS